MYDRGIGTYNYCETSLIEILVDSDFGLYAPCKQVGSYTNVSVALRYIWNLYVCDSKLPPLSDFRWLTYIDYSIAV